MILAASGRAGRRSRPPPSAKWWPPETSPLEVMRASYPRIDVREAMLVDTAGGVVTGGGGDAFASTTTLHLLAGMLGGAPSPMKPRRIMEYQRALARAKP